eukprot:365038-Chlamydomonas_euryale.AAC.5
MSAGGSRSGYKRSVGVGTRALWDGDKRISGWGHETRGVGGREVVLARRTLAAAPRDLPCVYVYHDRKSVPARKQGHHCCVSSLACAPAHACPPSSVHTPTPGLPLALHHTPTPGLPLALHPASPAHSRRPCL